MRQETLLPILGSYPRAIYTTREAVKIPKCPYTEQGKSHMFTENNKTRVNHEAEQGKRGTCQRKRGVTCEI
jgi:hypothetical protein